MKSLIEYIKLKIEILLKGFIIIPQGNINLTDLKKVCNSTFKGSKIAYYISDPDFDTCDISEVEHFLRWFKIYSSNRLWKPSHDCDNFSDFFMGISKAINPTICIGKVWVKISQDKAHALNIFIDKDNNVWYIEPQTCKIINPKDKSDYNPYFINI